MNTCAVKSLALLLGWCVAAVIWWNQPISHYTMGWFAYSAWAAEVNLDKLLRALAQQVSNEVAK